MQHLPIERLAELGDVEPSRDEAEHLASCPQCARERAAYRRLAGLAGVERSRIGPPLTEWSLLRARLAHDGIISRDGALWRDIALGSSRWLRQAAAAAVLIVGGLYAGRVSAGMSYSEALVVGHSAPVIDARSPASEFSSPGEALQVLNSAYERYSSAATYLAANDTLSSDDAFDRFRARLAFLDNVARSTRAALQEAPQDPLINQFYLSTLGARDATLHRMGQVVPVGNRLGRW
ncbi:MAG TPA: hypothetical protein VH762_09965 [Gemmatimonadaceae bacterium]|jgi:hypothetical protein